MKRSFVNVQSKDVVVLAPNARDEDITINYNEEGGILTVEIKPTEYTLKFKENFKISLDADEILDAELKAGVLRIKVIKVDAEG